MTEVQMGRFDMVDLLTKYIESQQEKPTNSITYAKLAGMLSVWISEEDLIDLLRSKGLVK